MERDVILGFIGLALTAGASFWAAGRQAFRTILDSQKRMEASQARTETKIDDLGEQVQDNRNEITGIKTRCIAFHPIGGAAR